MIAISVLLSSASLLQAADSLSLPARQIFANEVSAPDETSSFAKSNVSASWAPGYPKEWGSEDYRYRFNEPDPESQFSSTISPDEKYLAMTNGTHITFVDLEKNSTAKTSDLALPKGLLAAGLTLRPAPQGGYDVIMGSAATGKGDTPSKTIRIRVSSDFEPIGNRSFYEGRVGDISKEGKVASLNGLIYDLEGSDTPIATLTGQPDITYMSFSPDGRYLSTASWHARTADLWNVTSGEKVFQFPDTRAQNWVSQFSPDGKYITIAVGNNNNTVQLYMLSDLTTPPVEIKGFSDWPRNLAWSPDSNTLAVADRGRVRVFKIPSLEVTQEWSIADHDYISPNGIAFVDNGKKVTWMWLQGTYLYDFEKNIKWYWTPRVTDQIWGGMGFSFLSGKNTAVTSDGDATMRFWKL